MERFFPAILDKYKKLGINHLSPAEICLTSLDPSFSSYFYEQTGQMWSEVQDSYLPILEHHLEHPDKFYRYNSGKAFLHCLDQYSSSNQVMPKYILPDDSVLQKLSESLKSKNQSLLKILVLSDVDGDGFMTKSELVDALEKIELSPYDIVSCIRIAGFRPGINFVPIAGFCDLIGRSGCERKLKEFQLINKVLNAFSQLPGGIERVFRDLDKNRDGRLNFQEFRSGVRALELNIDLKDSKSLFALLDRDNSKSISLSELKSKLQELGSRPKKLLPASRSSSFDAPGEFVLKFLSGTIPNDSTLFLQFQRQSLKTTQMPIWGETLRIKANKRISCQLTLDYNGNNGSIDLASGVQSEFKARAKLGHYEIFLLAKYETMTAQEAKENRSALLIQRAWRQYSENHLTLKKSKKLLQRKTITAQGKRFLLGIYSVTKGIYCQLHPAFTDQVPQDTILSSSVFPEEDLESLLPRIIINPNLSISTIPDKKRIRGNLWVELLRLNNVAGLQLSYLEKNHNFQNVGEKLEIKELRLSKPFELYYSANNTKGSVFWIHAISTPFKWTVPAIVALPGKASFSLRFRWLVGSQLGEVEQAAIFIQKQWKAKKKVNFRRVKK